MASELQGSYHTGQNTVYCKQFKINYLYNILLLKYWSITLIKQRM